MRTPHGVATARQCTSTRNNNYFYPKSRGLEHSLWLPCHHALKLPIGYPPIAVLINLVERPADLFSTHAREHLLEHCLHPGVRKEANILGCLLYTSDAADEEDSVDLGGRRIIKKKKKKEKGGRLETIQKMLRNISECR
eukprot:TRINITY_DN2505_c0_g1_i5.p1 TRINITY_DN2505_c0_g1~~TRINITY_DN2505_c0_g1_i5.p1  ORF type:complete len:139 (-),score=10.30 TRINITY_DN2505_c0_g1_i5:34-450(-)